MKTTCRIICLLSAAVLLGTASCKKGEDDPVISLRTRKARLAGEWHLKSGSASLTVSNQYNQTFTFDGKEYTQNYTSSGGPLIVYIGTYILNLTITKDGTFTMKENLYGDVLEAQGTWSFNSGVGAEKKKEDALFLIDNVIHGSTTQEHLFNRMGTVFNYHLTELKNKELTIHSSGKVYADGGYYMDFSSDYTFAQ